MTELDIFRRPEYIHVTLNYLPDLRYDIGSLGSSRVINSPEPSCTDNGPDPHVHRGRFSLPGLGERTEGVQDNPRRER